jgi:hypothetical protein
MTMMTRILLRFPFFAGALALAAQDVEPNWPQDGRELWRTENRLFAFGS